jgi:hypothetical protein
VKYSLFVFFLFLAVIGQSQSVHRGRIIDSKTNEPLAFVNISVPELGVGTTSDVNGSFAIRLPKEAEKVRLTYVGYETKMVLTRNLKGDIKLKRKASQLKEVEIFPGKNPADSLMELVIDNKDKHDPFKIDQFAFDIYNRILVTVSDSAIDSLAVSTDTSSQEFAKHMSEHDLFMAETYSKKWYEKPGKVKEKILANRVAGLENPSFYWLATNMQPLSFYEPIIELNGSKYVSPLVKRSWNQYLFIIKDTLYRNQDTVFVVSYQPKSGKDFKSLEGILSINTNEYALENVIARSTNHLTNNLRIQQKYTRVKEEWFPEQLNFELKLNSIQFEEGAPIHMIGRSYINKVVFDTNFRGRDFNGLTVELDDQATKKSQAYWDSIRTDSLTQKEQNTYTFTDSAGESVNLDEKLFILESLVTQRIPIKFIDIKLDQIMSYNLYEGFRLGAGISTNDRMSKYIELGGYFAYGFRDKAWKYGGNLTLSEGRLNRYTLALKYNRDLHMPGYSNIPDRSGGLLTNDLTRFYVRWQNLSTRYKAEFKFPLFRDATVGVFGTYRQNEITNNYRIYSENESDVWLPFQSYSIGETGVNLRYAYNEEKVEMFNTVVKAKSPYPVLHLQYAKGMGQIQQSETYYDRYEARVEFSKKTPRLKQFRMMLRGSYLDGELPVTELYSPVSVYDPELAITSDYGFQTLLQGSYFGSELYEAHASFEFVKFNTSLDWFKPSLTAVQSAGWGSDQREDFTEGGFFYKTPEHGLFESGLVINGLYCSTSETLIPAQYGVGTFYRYGASNSGSWYDNFAVKLSFLTTF